MIKKYFSLFLLLGVSFLGHNASLKADNCCMGDLMWKCSGNCVWINPFCVPMNENCPAGAHQAHLTKQQLNTLRENSRKNKMLLEKKN